MVEYLIRLLTPQYKVATLSRGYGRKTKGIRLASDQETASTIGDEPFQIYRKFDGKVNVTVGEERALAIPYLLDEFDGTQVVIMDDAFQHRKVRPSFQIVLSDYHYPFFDDYLLPAGRLRESRKGISRADLVVFSKCPHEISEDQMMKFEHDTRFYTEAPIFFSTIRYGSPIALDHNEPVGDRVILFTGIANHAPIETHVSTHYNLIKHFTFSDHHFYTSSDLKAIVDLAKKENATVFTTEKDAVKLVDPTLKSEIGGIPLFFIPIETEFVKNGKDFDEMVINAINKALT
jgi:tetraacyldisaccharide 4'-kinase